MYLWEELLVVTRLAELDQAAATARRGAESLSAGAARCGSIPNPTASIPQILVPLDGSAQTARVLPVAAGLARRLHAETILLRVIAPANTGSSRTATTLLGALAPTARDSSRSAEAGSSDLTLEIDRAERQANAELERYQEAFSGQRVRRVVLVGADPAHEVLGWLRCHAVDFAVVPPPTSRWLGRLLNQGLADQLQRSGLVSVITAQTAP
jgi:nucleotide-binding universal stress UspA family protein